jgi:hypothetical protein
MCLVQALYAALYTGPPQAPDPPGSALELLNASATFVADGGGDASGGGVLTLRFTRAAAGTGHLASLGLPDYQTTVLSPNADIIWAVGANTAATGGGPPEVPRRMSVGAATEPSCAYHENTRGLRVIDWQDPSTNFVDEWKCSSAR